MRKQLILYTILLVPILTQGQTINSYVIFSADFQLKCLSIDSAYNRYTPSDSDVNYADILAEAFILLESRNFTRRKDIISNYNEYKKQYFGLINKADERIVLINAFYDNNDSIDYWKKQIVCVKGGGSSYLQIKINIDNHSQFDFFINTPK